MADLPKKRLIPSPPFYYTSVDYFGPFEIRVSRNKTEKRYGCLFACMVTRSVHLELAQSQSTPDFLNALRTFYNLRGKPRYLSSDNGTNFRGAEVELRQALSARDRDPLLQEEMLKENIMWQFQPPSAPHFGGIHEALVKSSKRALYKAMTQAQQRQRLREFELRTLLSEVTGFLNSRPLTYVGGDPEDLQALIPNHFLIQRASKNLAPIPVNQKAVNPRGSYRFVQSIVEDVWRLWQSEYLPTLLAGSKWRSQERNLCVGDVVLVVDNI
ncbi:uncharacterized protein LOC131892635 [Tigriopus californicus]|uniref:uncharacterized protein LOC131892635 n=1 Tax=Tigriopus californicus TaxID=6832 RepID=UPI0027DA7CBB|nr:uncharacterized protein LOC131892635 [Tigriopus californicus]